MQFPRDSMSRVTRVEIDNLVTKAQQQVKQAKELLQQLEELADRIETDERKAPKATTGRKIHT